MPQYQGVWTLEQQAQAQSNQQWVTDPNFKNTTLLLQADGTGSGSQNQTFLDGSTNNFFITRNGNTTQGSFSPFSQAPGYWSNYQSAVDTNYLNFTTSAGTLFQFTGDFTIEAWVSLATTANGASVWVTNDGSANYFALNLNTTTFDIYLNSSGSTNTIPHGLVIGQWSHIAMVRSGSTITLYTNGVAKGTLTNSSTLGYASPSIARNGGGGNVSWYLSNLRIVKSAVYTTNFTPQTTPLTNITNTSLLTCQSNRFVDNSSNALVPTLTGTPSVQAFGPFAPALQWTPDVVGGSGYFDGSDYLTLSPGSAFAFGTSDFTVETWFYPTSAPTDDYIIEARNSGQTNTWTLNFAYGGTSGQLNWGYNGTTLIAATTNDTVKPYIWSHIAYTRTGTTGSLYVNGVRVGTGTDSSNYSVSPTTSYIGCRFSTANFADGYFSGMRVVNGTALYTGTSYTIPTAPPTAITNTSLLLNYTNAGIYDGKMGNVLETVGNAQVATSPVKYGSGSMYFDGTGDWLLIPNNQMLNLNADFTIEFWIYLNSTSGEQSIFHNHNSDNNGIIVSVNGGAAGKIRLGAGNGSSFYVLLDSSTAISTSTWNHVACTRNNNTWTIYINGSNAGSTTNASNPTFSTSDLIQIGRFTSGTPNALNAYLDDFRITKACRYFANFTPPQQALPRQ